MPAIRTSCSICRRARRIRCRHQSSPHARTVALRFGFISSARVRPEVSCVRSSSRRRLPTSQRSVAARGAPADGAPRGLHLRSALDVVDRGSPVGTAVARSAAGPECAEIEIGSRAVRILDVLAREVEFPVRPDRPPMVAPPRACRTGIAGIFRESVLRGLTSPHRSKRPVRY